MDGEKVFSIFLVSPQHAESDNGFMTINLYSVISNLKENRKTRLLGIQGNILISRGMNFKGFFFI